MKLYHIVAVATNRVIGLEGRLPWHFSSDLKKFKELTMGSTVIMGRRTFESIGRVLPGRTNFVLTRREVRGQENPKFFTSLDEALRRVTTAKAFVIGGESLYRETMNRIDGIWLTRIHEDYKGDAYYPEIPASFKEVKKEILQKENPKIELIYLENTKAPARVPS